MDLSADILPANRDPKAVNSHETQNSDNCTLTSGHSTSTIGHSRQSSLSELPTFKSCFESVSDRLKIALPTADHKHQEPTKHSNKIKVSIPAKAKTESEAEPAEKNQVNGHRVAPGEFEQENHFYPRVLNAQIHPLVASFFDLGNERIIARYVHLRPMVDQNKLRELLSYRPKYFSWAGSDLFNVTTSTGQHQMIVVETNSCPSGQKSMPPLRDYDEFGGYRVVMRSAFRDLLEDTECEGDLAVVYDKNAMEASGYAAVLAEEGGEHVWLVEFDDTDSDPPVRWRDR
ncbi:hypothetical protein GGI22_006414, partial [Coemansia erecta]